MTGSYYSHRRIVPVRKEKSKGVFSLGRPSTEETSGGPVGVYTILDHPPPVCLERNISGKETDTDRSPRGWFEVSYVE